MAKKTYKLIFTSDTTGAVEGLEALEQHTKTAKKNYNSLTKELSQGFDAKKFSQAHQELQKASNSTIQKLDILKKRLTEMEQQDGGVTKENQKAFNALRKEIANTESQAEKLQAELQNLNKIRLDSIKKTIQEVSDRLGKIGRTLTTTATLPILAAGTASVKMASDMEESLNKVQVSFGDSASIVEDFSNTTLITYGIAKSSALEMSSFFGDMATSMGASKSEAADMSKTLVGLAGDLASFKNISIDEAQTALAGIFTGETEALKKLGIVMTEANLANYALTKGITKSISEMSQYEKMALRMNYVLDSTKNAQGDFARTSDGTANQLRILTESLKDVAAMAGKELIPIVLPMIQNINELLSKVGELDDGTKKAIITFALFVATLGPAFTVTSKIIGIIPVLSTAYDALKAKLTGTTAAQTALNAAQASNPMGAVITVISLLISALGSYALAASLTADKTESLSESVKEATKAIDDNVTAQMGELAYVEKLATRFYELNGKVGDDISKRRELANIVSQINSILPNTLSLVDEEAGLYKELSGSIDEVVEAKKRLIQAEAAESKAKEFANAQLQLLDEYGVSSKEELEATNSNLKKSKEDAKNKEYSTGNWFKDFFANFVLKYNAFGDSAEIEELDGQIEAAQKALKKYNEYDKKLNELLKQSTTSGLGNDSGSDSGSDSGGGGTTKAAVYLSETEYLYEVGLIGYQEYLSRLQHYRDNYFEKNTSDWYSADLKLRKAQQEHQQQMLADFEDFVNNTVSLAEKEANAKIAAIDAELAARKKLQESTNKQLQLEHARAKLAFTTDTESRKSLQKEIKRLENDIKEAEIEAAAKKEKEAIQAQIDALKVAGEMAVSNMQQSYAAAGSTTNNNTTTNNMTINANGLTAVQVEQMIVDVYNRIMYGG